MKKIKRLLIANRGEIALRIIRTCKELGITCSVIYSQADRYAPFVRSADEGYLVGDAPATDSYLNTERIVEVVKKAKCDAVHPGYGFLSENPAFVQRLENEGIIFVGPSSKAIQALGNKTSARSLAQSLRIPTIPGTNESVKNEAKAITIANRIKYPILLKAAGGGGGKGMKIVRSQSELPKLLKTAMSEAKAAFNDENIYIEKYLENPRHIEVQILADAHGNAVHLGERECSIQRRHQKIIEESPANALSNKLQSHLFDAAVTLVKHVGYINAGTIEFLLDGDDNFYFLEVNARLQVEHPVTEQRTGIDLVREQILIAEGQQLAHTQKNITFKGHSIECRICAEDPSENFFPATGTIASLQTPGGLGIREDRGVEEGTEITSFYDSLLSKLIAWGNDRTETLNRMSRALDEYRLYGVKNNLGLCRWIIEHPQFRKGNYDTNFLEHFFNAETLSWSTDEQIRDAAIFAVLYDKARKRQKVLQSEPNQRQWYKKRFDAMR